MELGAHRQPVVNRQVTIACRTCSAELITATVDDSGHVAVPAAYVIDGMASRSRECPHNVQTLEDQRRLIEDTIAAAAQE
jgi:hypothetical protein